MVSSLSSMSEDVIDITQQQNTTSTSANKVRVDLNEQQIQKQREIEREVNELEQARDLLQERLSQILQEKLALNDYCTRSESSVARTLFEIANEQKCSHVDTTGSERKQQICSSIGKSSAIASMFYPFANIDGISSQRYEILTRDLFNISDSLNNLRDDVNQNRQEFIQRLINSLRPIIEMQPVDTPTDSEACAQQSKDSISLLRYLKTLEECKKNNEPVSLSNENCKSFIQLVMERMNNEFQILSTPSISQYADISICKRIIEATTYLLKCSVHWSQIWRVIVNNGVLDCFVNALSNRDIIDLGITRSISSFFQEATSCDNSTERNLVKANLFHRWFQAGNGIVYMIDLLKQTVIEFESQLHSSVPHPTSPVTKSRLDKPPLDRNDFSGHNGSTSEPIISATITQHYHIVFNLLCTLWNLSRSQTLQTYIQNSLCISSYRGILMEFPEILSKGFKTISGVMYQYLEPIHVAELQKLILKICSNISVGVPEYIVLMSKLSLERYAVESIGNDILFFDSIFTFVSYANSPYLNQKDVHALTSILVYNILKPTSNIDMLIRCIRAMSIILKEEKLFEQSEAAKCNYFLTSLKEIETDEQMRRFGESFNGKENEILLKKVTGSSVRYLEKNGYSIPQEEHCGTNEQNSNLRRRSLSSSALFATQQNHHRSYSTPSTSTQSRAKKRLSFSPGV